MSLNRNAMVIDLARHDSWLESDLMDYEVYLLALMKLMKWCKEAITQGWLLAGTNKLAGRSNLFNERDYSLLIDKYFSARSLRYNVNDKPIDESLNNFFYRAYLSSPFRVNQLYLNLIIRVFFLGQNLSIFWFFRSK